MYSHHDATANRRPKNMGENSKTPAQCANSNSSDPHDHADEFDLIPVCQFDCKWSSVGRIGKGLVNPGNTCFLNSVLQCLIYIPGLRNYLLNVHQTVCKTYQINSSSGNVNGFCVECCLANIIKSTTLSTESNVNNSAFLPKNLLYNLKLIAKPLRVGRQEDAHEFYCLLIDSLLTKDVKLFSLKGMERKAPIFNLFGGILKSNVQCSKCSKNHTKYDNIMDLNVDIQFSNSLDKAISRYFRTETLDSNNQFKCDKCGKYSMAKKKFSFMHLPSVLTIQLKRFTPMAEKIRKFIEFPTKLDLTSALDDKMKNKNDICATYDLNGVVVHHGSTSNSGHYFSFVKNSNGLWYEMNDERISQVKLNTVLQQSAYLLFYTKTDDQLGKKHVSASNPVPATKTSNTDPPTGNSNPIKSNGVTPNSGNKKSEVAATPKSKENNVDIRTSKAETVSSNNPSKKTEKENVKVGVVTPNSQGNEQTSDNTDKKKIKIAQQFLKEFSVDTAASNSLAKFVASGKKGKKGDASDSDEGDYNNNSDSDSDDNAAANEKKRKRAQTDALDTADKKIAERKTKLAKHEVIKWDYTTFSNEKQIVNPFVKDMDTAQTFVALTRSARGKKTKLFEDIADSNWDDMDDGGKKEEKNVVPKEDQIRKRIMQIQMTKETRSEWDIEYDQGKQKKVRLIENDFGKPNPFQMKANRNQQFSSQNEGGKSGNGQYRNRDHQFSNSRDGGRNFNNNYQNRNRDNRFSSQRPGGRNFSSNQQRNNHRFSSSRDGGKRHQHHSRDRNDYHRNNHHGNNKFNHRGNNKFNHHGNDKFNHHGNDKFKRKSNFHQRRNSVDESFE